jgi:hypothetical protein
MIVFSYPSLRITQCQTYFLICMDHSSAQQNHFSSPALLAHMELSDKRGSAHVLLSSTSVCLPFHMCIEFRQIFFFKYEGKVLKINASCLKGVRFSLIIHYVLVAMGGAR